jgi:hypothetical protein
VVESAGEDVTPSDGDSDAAPESGEDADSDGLSEPASEAGSELAAGSVPPKPESVAPGDGSDPLGETVALPLGRAPEPPAAGAYLVTTSANRCS